MCSETSILEYFAIVWLIGIMGAFWLLVMFANGFVRGNRNEN